ncbi:pancreatic triacylglycerol lipase-like [Centruroides sculpturatus]|uniref:pancreatic triacylglycerol lipase-like n=1 Tax=Centruroides sculpturatus TaxID=218467 RepID=UPI000C6DBD94|nr:pancreatic triacylglycerol lipase-like [Centruroides sculpturatus]XP_023230833.1 pancreatic triacylglycerol lipase-like [Centruroides sculpturatus]
MLYLRLVLLSATVYTTLSFYQYPLFKNLDDDEPSDYEVWKAIFTSLARWREMKKKKAQRPHHHIQRRSEGRVCYSKVGCFQDDGAFDYLNTLPASPDVVGTKFILHTRKNAIEGDLLHYNDSSSLYFSHFNGSNPIKIIIHGFGSSSRRAWVKQMTEALLFVEDVNVIVVDWEKGCALPNYVQAAANCQLVGKEIALLIKMINYERGTTNQDYHLIGFSLGAHVAGFAGRELKHLKRITGLDPASPLFEGYSAKVRLDPSDADYIDVIHSNGNSFLKGGLGSFEPMGHADFYPNGGRIQVGCNNIFIGAISDIFYGNWQSLCNHRRAFRFFIDSILPGCIFTAFNCESFEKFISGQCIPCSGDGCGQMGYHAKGRGKFYLVTRETEPFCANQYKVSMMNSQGQGKTWGKFEITLISKDSSNETFVLSHESQEITDTQVIQGLIVAHPKIRNLTQFTIKYTKYRGWIYNGLDEWMLDKILIHDSYGQKYSYCGLSTIIKDGESKTLPLTMDDCQLKPPLERTARLIWEVVSDAVVSPHPRPPTVLWKFMLDENGEWQKL